MLNNLTDTNRQFKETTTLETHGTNLTDTKFKTITLPKLETHG